jgi:CubicO group peptidase (beta-lactamase class C family)
MKSGSLYFQKGVGVKLSLIITLLLILLIGDNQPTLALIQDNSPLTIYTAQADDSLSHLADKYYQDPLVWPVIFQATNDLALTDSRFTALDSPHVLKPGQRLAIPDLAGVDRLIADAATSNPLPQHQLLSAAWLADFTAYVEATRQHFGIPGTALAIVRDNQIVLAEGFGVRELGRAEPVTPETVFGIGSTTKAMNSMLIARLVDESLLDWDQPVVEIWPDFKLSDPAVTPQIRVRDLLNMGSGVPRADLVWSGAGLTAEQVMESLAELPVVAPPGRRFQYNNQLVATGGFVAALAAGAPYGQLEVAYADLLGTRIFEPIGMRSATLSIDAARANSNYATPHDFTLFGEVLPLDYHAETGIAPAGAVNANVLDLARFLMTQLNEGIGPTGTRVVSKANLAETWRPQIQAYGETYYGMGWFIETYEGVELIWHDGDVLGFKSLLVLIPEAKVGMALLTNRTISVGFSSSIRYRLVEALYGREREAGIDYKDQWDGFMAALPEIRAPLATTLTSAEAAPYLGQYTDGWRVEQRADGTLWAMRGPYGWQLLAAGHGEFVVNNGFGITTPLQFSEDERGTMTMKFRLSTGEAGEYQLLN